MLAYFAIRLRTLREPFLILFRLDSYFIWKYKKKFYLCLYLLIKDNKSKCLEKEVLFNQINN